MNPNQLKRLFPNASQSTIKANSSEGARTASEPKRDLGYEPLEKNQDKEGNPSRIILSYKIFRARLLDPDNCFTKYHTDALRYERLIKDDRDEDVEIRVQQIKSKEEYVEIEIIYP